MFTSFRYSSRSPLTGPCAKGRAMAAEGVEPGGAGEGEAADGETGRPSVEPFMRGLRGEVQVLVKS